MSTQPKILLVMHEVPLNSGFLASKFIKLAEKLDVHLLVWDSRQNIDAFIAKYNLPDSYRKKIHCGYSGAHEKIAAITSVITGFFTNKKFKSYILNGADSIKNKLKAALIYAPVIKLNPKIIHFEFGTLAVKGVAVSNFTDAKMSVSFRGYDLNYAGLDDKSYYSEVWNKCKGFHFLGNDLKKRALERGYINKGIEVLIPPAIDTVFFKPINNNKPVDQLKIVSVGRLVWKKGYEYAIRAASILKEKGIHFEYNIVGDGAHLQALQFIIKESGLENNVKLLGALSAEATKEQLEQSHLFVHPAISEGFSNAVLEAQAMGLPVICTDADGLPENIEDMVTGFVVRKWDTEAIAEKLIFFSENREKISEMGLKGIERVNKYFTIDKQIEAFANFYSSIHNAS
ncbi:MAG: glycosyltransferase [Flavipsychrobacter sp.]